VIIFSTVLLALDNPTTRKDTFWVDVFSYCDDTFLVIFSIEFVVKAFAFGFIWCDNIEFMLADQDSLKQLVLGNTGEPSYLYNPWNYLDLVVLLVGYLGKVGDPDCPLKVLRLVRAFRPLRMVNRISGMKLVLGALAAALPQLANVCALLIAVFLIFAILGLSLFMGKFYFCTDDSVSGKTTCTGSFVDSGYLKPRVWANPRLGGYEPSSFDNIYDAFMVLFAVATGDSWENVLYCIVDAPGEAGEQPVRDQNRWAGMYLIFFVFVGQLFMLQLFVSVIIDSFNFAQGSGLLTKPQALYTDFLKLSEMLHPEPKPQPAAPSGWRLTAYNMFMSCDPLPVTGLEEYTSTGRVVDIKSREQLHLLQAEIETLHALRDSKPLTPVSSGKLRRLEEQLALVQQDVDLADRFSVYALAHQPRPEGWPFIVGKHFDIVITTCIMMSIGFMCTVHYEQSEIWDDLQKYQNYFFLSIFVFEFVIKHVGLGFGAYWSSPFDALDGCVVLVSLLFCFVPGGAIAGLFRIGRVLRLIKRFPQLRALMTSMISVVPAISNVFAVLLLVFFVFAVIGVQLFASVRFGFTINQDNNFQTWQMAMLALWRETLGNWRANMYDTQVSGFECSSGFEQIVDGRTFTVNDCGTPYGSATPTIAMFYHVLFQVFSKFAVLNVVIAIILGAFTWCYSLEQSELTSGLAVTADNLRHFKAIWDRFDLNSSGQIDVKDLALFLSILQWNIPSLLSTGILTQSDELLYSDYVSFALDTKIDEKLDEHAREVEILKRRRSREKYAQLIERIGDFERSQEIWKQLDAASCDIQMGCNDNVAGFETSLHPLGSLQDADLHIFTKEINNDFIYVPTYDVNKTPPRAEVLKVEFMTLIRILTMEPLQLDRHDCYVCFGYKDPFSYFQPGYFKDKSPIDGKVFLNLDEESVKPPKELSYAKSNQIQRKTHDIGHKRRPTINA